MYLSRIRLDIGHSGVRHALRDCNELHRDLMSAFPQTQTEQAARQSEHLLFRLIECRSEISLLMVSDSMPDMARLSQRGYILTPENVRDISALHDIFCEGLCLRFELLASPCKKVGFEGTNSRRVFLKTEKERAEWLTRQGGKYGFSICDMQEDAQQVSVEGNKKGMRIRYEAVRFTGILEITDAEAFWYAYRQGIGPGKAYGLGMLTVARVV